MLNLTDHLPDSPALDLYRAGTRIPHHRALLLAADVVATQIVRGTLAARDLSDRFAEAKVRLPLLNWPTAALEPLRRPSVMLQPPVTDLDGCGACR
jgi:hypothetical protein